MPISEIRDRVSQGLLDFAWRQWSQIGASTTVGGADRWAVDPEALILFTTGIARRDPRLFDEMLDWMAFNHELLSTQRLRNLAGRFALPPGLVAAVIAWTRQGAPTHLTPATRQSLSGTGCQSSAPMSWLSSRSRIRSSLSTASSVLLPQEPASHTSRTRPFQLTCPSGFATYSGQAAAPRRCEYC